MRVGDIPREQLIKAQTLGASTAQIASRIVLPQILPRLIDSVRLEIGPAWLFLIAAEAIAAAGGLGYRMLLDISRFLAMDVILPYVFWITLLAWAMDALLALLQRKASPWFILGAEFVTTVVFDHVWKEYGDAIVLEDIFHRHRAMFVRGNRRAFRLRQDHVAPHGARRGAISRGAILLDNAPRHEPDSDRGVVFQRYSCFHI